MVLSEREQDEIIKGVFKKHFPGASGDDKAKVTDLVKRGFMPNYSPLPEENISPLAARTGASLADFTTVIARGVTKLEPEDVDREKLGEMLRKVYTI